MGLRLSDVNIIDLALYLRAGVIASTLEDS
jgi:hypothetical protein